MQFLSSRRLLVLGTESRGCLYTECRETKEMPAWLSFKGRLEDEGPEVPLSDPEAKTQVLLTLGDLCNLFSSSIQNSGFCFCFFERAEGQELGRLAG